MIQKILIVDDEPEVLDVTGSMLRKREYEVSTATNGLIALQEIKDKRPDLILLDVLMPEMDGYELYKQLKGNPLTNDIPVLIVTARGNMEDSFKVIGVDGFISKPFSPDDLMNEIEHVKTLLQSKENLKDAGTRSRPKILVVGNTQVVLENMTHQAQRAGFDITTVSSGTDVIAQGVKLMPHIIFIDVQVKDMTANTLIDILRRLPQFERKPIIGYCYYEVDRLGESQVRQDILKIDELSKSFLNCGATAYIGRYNHHNFIQAIISQLKNKSYE